MYDVFNLVMKRYMVLWLRYLFSSLILFFLYSISFVSSNMVLVLVLVGVGMEMLLLNWFLLLYGKLLVSLVVVHSTMKRVRRMRLLL